MFLSQCPPYCIVNCCCWMLIYPMVRLLKILSGLLINSIINSTVCWKSRILCGMRPWELVISYLTIHTFILSSRQIAGMLKRALLLTSLPVEMSPLLGTLFWACAAPQVHSPFSPMTLLVPPLPVLSTLHYICPSSLHHDFRGGTGSSICTSPSWEPGTF